MFHYFAYLIVLHIPLQHLRLLSYGKEFSKYCQKINASEKIAEFFPVMRWKYDRIRETVNISSNMISSRIYRQKHRQAATPIPSRLISLLINRVTYCIFGDRDDVSHYAKLTLIYQGNR